MFRIYDLNRAGQPHSKSYAAKRNLGRRAQLSIPSGPNSHSKSPLNYDPCPRKLLCSLSKSSGGIDSIFFVGYFSARKKRRCYDDRIRLLQECSRDLRKVDLSSHVKTENVATGRRDVTNLRGNKTRKIVEPAAELVAGIYLVHTLGLVGSDAGLGSSEVSAEICCAIEQSCRLGFCSEGLRRPWCARG